MSFIKKIISVFKPSRGSKVTLKDVRETIIDENFCDIRLSITDIRKEELHNNYTIKGLYNNQVIGLQVGLIRNIPYGISKEGDVNTESGFVTTGLLIRSIGSETNSFLKAISNLYGIISIKNFSKSTTTATIFSLNSSDINLDVPGYYKFKVFFNENEDETLYAELYVNINTVEKWIEFHEKDPEYRKALINTFTL